MSATTAVKRVYNFSEGSRDMRMLLGGKGANVAEMTRLGLPVPGGFTITTRACIDYLAGGHVMPAGLDVEISRHLAALEQRTGKRLGDPHDPLLVSVRSGAPESMPGMMDTVLNLGLNDASVEGLAARTGNPRFAYDSYRRFIQMFGDVVAGVDRALFEGALTDLKQARGVAQDVDLSSDDLRGLVDTFKQIYRDHLEPRFPAGAPSPARRVDQCGLRELGQPARQGLPPGPPYPRRPRYGGQRAADGLRQHRTAVGHRSGLHPQQHDRRGRRAIR